MSKKDVIITIFGSTGDLTARKLLPALNSLYQNNAISKNSLILAVGRKPYSTKEYLDEIAKITNKKLEVESLLEFVTYVQMEITKLEDYEILKQIINKNAQETTKKLFYLAVAPNLFIPLAKNIHESSLISKGNLQENIIFEKPFGSDLKSAKQINKTLWQYFSEEQIYRIDHYLGKESIQNIMTMRFANRIFEAVWNREHIKSITIFAKEDFGILNRGAYYEESGALKDMVQSHLLQVLALLSMEAPKTYFSKDVKNKKVKALKKLTFDKNSTLFGQYKGYLSEKAVKENSKTETYVFLKAFVNTKRFKNVPFYLITGKKLNKKESGILIEFKETKEQKKWGLPLKTNQLFIEIAPNDGIKSLFNAKIPGLRDNIQQVELEYASKTHIVGNIPEAYERLLLDALQNSKTLFTRWDEIEVLWKITDKIKQAKKDLIIYENEAELNAILSKIKN